MVFSMSHLNNNSNQNKIAQKQSNQNQTTNNSQKNQQDSYDKFNNCESVEPLPESSRPRRDGPGGEDAQ